MRTFLYLKFFIILKLLRYEVPLATQNPFLEPLWIYNQIKITGVLLRRDEFEHRHADRHTEGGRSFDNRGRYWRMQLYAKECQGLPVLPEAKKRQERVLP